MSKQRRAADKGWLCRVARTCSLGWDWVDARDIDKHLISLAILFGTVKVTSWAMGYASAATAKTGLEVAAVIAAVLAPYMALQAAAVAWHFKARGKAS